MKEPTIIREQAHIPAELEGLRFDQALAKLFPQFSRARLQAWIKAGAALLDGKPAATKTKVSQGQTVNINAELLATENWSAQALELNIAYEDEHIIVIDKPAGLVVHPAAGNPDRTLVNALLNHAPELSQLPRAGIVHRLDKDTSGLLVAARSLIAHTQLVRQIQQRQMHREYFALVYGNLISGGTIDAPIGRHPTQRIKMAVVNRGKSAITHYRIIDKFNDFTSLRVILDTGRTHQIRVHLAYIGHPIVGDPVYGKLLIPKGAGEIIKTALLAFRRQALHAQRLSFEHPISKELLQFESKLPADIQHLLNVIRIT